MSENKVKHLLYVPFTGLGFYGGMRGRRWLKNRITIFKQFVVKSLLGQTNRDFTLWISWRQQERGNKRVLELEQYLKDVGLDAVFTYGGLCFWDDKFEKAEAWDLLATNLHHTLRDLVDVVAGTDYVLMTIQPSDDCYPTWAVEKIQEYFRNEPTYQAGGFTKGYIMDYLNKTVAEYNPTTNPPFYTIKFPKDTFIDSYKHMKYTGPYESHEYVPNFLKYAKWDTRGFLVGTHGENISTHFNIPFKGEAVDLEVLKDFNLYDVPACNINIGWRRRWFRKLPHYWQRKLRYIFGEKFFARLYKALILS